MTVPSTRNEIKKALRSGVLIKPDRCERCSKIVEKPAGIVAHHHHGYDEDHLLDIVWLCRKCHGIEHDGMRGLSAELSRETMLRTRARLGPEWAKEQGKRFGKHTAEVLRERYTAEEIHAMKSRAGTLGNQSRWGNHGR